MVKGYTLYKRTKSGKGGAVEFELNVERQALYVSAAHQKDDTHFDWDAKIVMKLGLADIGGVLSLLERRVQKKVDLFHRTDSHDTNLELAPAEGREEAGYVLAVARKRKVERAWDRVRIGVTEGEAAVLVPLFRAAVVRLAGW